MAPGENETDTPGIGSPSFSLTTGEMTEVL